MKKFTLITTCIMAGIFANGCATTKPALEVEVRPIVQEETHNTPTNSDVQAALDHARNLQNIADYAASYRAYNAVLMTLDTDNELHAQAMLGLADSSLALTWQDAKYENKARIIYKKISQQGNSSNELMRRAEAGLLLLNLPDFTPKAAQKHLAAALENNADDPRLWNALGKLHDDNSDWLDALDAYIKALTAAKKNGQSTAAVVNNMGMSLLMQGRKKEALAKFKQAKKASPEMPVYDNNLRLAQTLSGKTDKAIKGLSDTRTAQIYNDAGVIAQAQGNITKAASLYKKAIKTSPVYFELAEENLAGLG